MASGKLPGYGMLARRTLRELANADASLGLPARNGTQLVNFFSRFESRNIGIRIVELDRAGGMNAYAREYRHIVSDLAQARFTRLSPTAFACALCDNARIELAYEGPNAFADQAAAHVAGPVHGTTAVVRAARTRKDGAQRRIEAKSTASNPT